MSSWREERRKDRAAEAEAKRADQLAAAEAEAVRMAAMADARRAATAQEHAHQQQCAEAKQAAKDKRRAQRAAKLAALRGWAGAHVVHLLIYPLALVSAAMAVPAMADYGHHLYGMAIGLALPLLSELGMWAFALAVEVSRARYPQRPVWALQVGVWLFAGVNFTLNLLHGLERGLSAGAAMGLVSVAGVVAHQLTVAGARRTRTERAEARIDRQAARKVARVRRAAVRHAVAEIDAHGAARLVYTPGRYVLAGRTRRRLEAAIVPGLPVESASTDWDGELAGLLATGTLPANPHPEASEGESDPGDRGAVGTLDPTGDQEKSRADRGRIGGRVGRSLAELRAALDAAIEAGQVDPTSAESIRKALRCAPKYARQLRDEYRQGGHQ
ncbi:hypothetical protein [Prauserella muralis]|uniref:Uncharacterized protein n=1 Tax=Prauserella muralis TaxID=588067 RepID=A0A2V4BDG5_9PSEU|nr:hypothetical protein [Prauserella muralis]PXY32109.1 hypothetical protein BAY60_07370 [Prauserella muralis]TWE24242.1 hypothetical protein FHX69_5555 [Prauserella muralis]